jgi:hypothetical protein
LWVRALLVTGWFWATSGTQAQQGCQAVFVSPRAQHVSYRWASERPGLISLRLTVSGPGISATVAQGGSAIEGFYRLDTSGGGTFAFVLEETFHSAEGVQSAVTPVYSAVTTAQLGGTCLQDETVSGAGPLANLTVPGGVRLEIREWSDTGVNDVVFNVQGKLAVDGLVRPGGALSLAGSGDITLRRFRPNGPLSGQADGRVDIAGSRLDGPVTLSAREILIEDSLLTADPSGYAPAVTLTGGLRMELRRSELLGGDVQLEGVGASVHDCIFRRALILGDTLVAMPEIRGNSFLGVMAVVGGRPGWSLTQPNYFGDPAGAVNTGWLGHQGARSLVPSTGLFTRQGPGRVCSLPDDRPVPWIRVEGCYGQNVLVRSGGPASGRVNPRAGRKTLFCFNLMPLAEAVPGARYRLQLGGIDYLPVNPGHLARRDHGDPQYPASADRTLNFVIPETVVAGTYTARLLADLSSCGGFEPGSSEVNLWEEPVAFDPPFGRPLRIGVTAVSIDVPGYASQTDPGNPAAQRASSLSKLMTRLRADLVTHWPLTESEVTLVNLGPYAFEGTFLGAGLARLSSVGFAYTLAAELEDLRTTYNAIVEPLDFVVAVLPATALGAANEGASLRGFRTIALVDEGSPGAALHELGHALGLYQGVTDSEQYDLATGEDGAGNLVIKGSGAYLQGVTAFNGSQRHTPAFSGDLWHFPSELRSAVFDFMGGKEPHWIVPSSLNVVHAALRTLLGTRVRAAADPAQPPRVLRPMFEADQRFVLVRGLYLHDRDPETGGWTRRFIQDSVQILDWAATDRPTPTDNSDVFLDALFEALDAQGVAVARRPCQIRRAVDPQPGDLVPFAQVFEVPEKAVLLKLWNTSMFGHPIELVTLRNRTKQPNLWGRIAAFPSGAGIDVQWQTAQDTLGRPLKPRLFMDQGEGWVPLATPTFTNRLMVPTQDLSGSVRFHLALANAFDSIALAGSPMALPGRSPIVDVIRPRSGDVGEASRVWSLEAAAPGTASCRWWSSRDGWLGDGARLAGVSLSEGTHELRCITADSGLTSTSAVSVAVGPVTAADLELTDSGLSLVPSGVDPLQRESWSGLIPGRETRVSLRLHNPGITNTVRLRLLVTPAGEPQQLLLETNYVPVLTEDICVAVDYLPHAVGHTFVGEVSSPLLTDPYPANNMRAWIITNQPPVAHGARLTLTPGGEFKVQLAAYDPELAPLSYRIVQPPQLGQAELEGRHLRYRAGAAVGTDRVVFCVKDGMLESSPATVFIHVRQPAAAGPPVFTETSITGARQGEPMSYTLKADHDPVAFGALSLPAGLVLDQARGILAGTPEVAGNSSFTLMAWNDLGATTQTFTGWFASSAPVVTSMPSTAAVRGEPFSFQLASTPAAEWYQISGLPLGLAVDSTGGRITGSTTQEGSYTLGVTASNRWGRGYQALQLAVVPAAQALDFFHLRRSLSGASAIDSASTLQATRETAEPYHAGNPGLLGSVWWSWTAPQDGPVMVSTEGSGFDTVLAVYTGSDYTRLALVAANDNFRWDTSSRVLFPARAGTTYQIVVDGSSRGSVALQLAYHDAPLITSPLSHRAIAGQPFTHSIQALNRPLHFAAEGLPAGLTVDAATGVISGIAPAKTAGWVVLTATNEHGMDSLRCYLEVMSAEYPVFLCASHAAAVYGEPFEFDASATHATAGYRAWPLPAGLSLDTATGRVSGIPWAAGVHRVLLDASNNAGEVAGFGLLINVRLPYDLWLQSYVLPAGKQGPQDDADGDGASNDQERVCGTNPQDPGDVLACGLHRSGGTWVLTWRSVPGYCYRVQAADQLGGEWWESPTIEAREPISSLPAEPESGRFWRVVLRP